MLCDKSIHLCIANNFAMSLNHSTFVNGKRSFHSGDIVEITNNQQIFIYDKQFPFAKHQFNLEPT